MKRPGSLHSEQGFTLIEAVIGVLLTAIFLLSFIATSGKMNQSRVQHISRTKAVAATASVLQDIRGQAWDESLVGLPKTSSTTARSPIGTDGDDAAGTYDDLDDYDGYSAVNGPFTTSVGVYYSTWTISGSTITMSQAANGGKGVIAGDRTDFKLIVASTSWNGGSVSLNLILGNGH